MFGLNLSTLVVLSLFSAINCQLKFKNMYVKERKFAPCLFKQPDLAKTHDLVFSIFDKTGQDFCLTTSVKERNANGIAAMLRAGSSSVVVMKTESVTATMLSGASGFEVTAKSALTSENLGSMCYVCDMVPKGKAWFPSKDRINLSAYKVKLLDPTKISLFKPSTPLVERKRGESLTIQCDATSSPDKPTVSIKRDKTSGFLAKAVGSVKYTLNNLTKKDTGVYYCEAISENVYLLNAGKNADKKKLDLQVNFKPRFLIEKIIKFTSKGVNEELKVEIDANPKPTLKCALANQIQENRMVKYDAFENYHRFMVSIPKVQERDVGEYKCTASNKLGSGTMFFNLRWKPGRLNITSPKSTDKSNFYNLRWEVATHKNAPITSYNIIVRYKVSKNKWEIAKNFSVTNTKSEQGKVEWHHTGKNRMLGSHLVYGLQPDSVHKLSIVASNKHGASEEVSTEFKTPVNNTKTFQDPSNPQINTIVHCKAGTPGCNTASPLSATLGSTVIITLLAVVQMRLLSHL